LVDIAKEYGVSRGAIQGIVRHINWSHVPIEIG
jgi:hypothetical protein